MTGVPPAEQLVVEWASHGAALEGEPESGDLEVVAGYPHGTLVAVIDGLGHGVEAAEASREAARVLRRFAGEPVTVLVERCHEALRGSRGVAMSLAAFDARSSALSWVGVGNVEAILLRAGAGKGRESVTTRGGVVGYQLPPLRAPAVSVAPGDTLVMATDGIRSAFLAELRAHVTPERLARTVFSRHARGTDDALVLVARYVGSRP
jgi:phosphoserine phosphatase RsbX